MLVLCFLSFPSYSSPLITKVLKKERKRRIFRQPQEALCLLVKWTIILCSHPHWIISNDIWKQEKKQRVYSGREIGEKGEWTKAALRL